MVEGQAVCSPQMLGETSPWRQIFCRCRWYPFRALQIGSLFEGRGQHHDATELTTIPLLFCTAVRYYICLLRAGRAFPSSFNTFFDYQRRVRAAAGVLFSNFIKLFHFAESVVTTIWIFVKIYWTRFKWQLFFAFFFGILIQDYAFLRFSNCWVNCSYCRYSHNNIRFRHSLD